MLKSNAHTKSTSSLNLFFKPPINNELREFLSLADQCRYMQTNPEQHLFFGKLVRQGVLQTFCMHVVRGEQAEVEKLLDLHPERRHVELILQKTTLEDDAGRVFKAISAFQYAVWAMDTPMCLLLINAIKKLNKPNLHAEMQHQYGEAQTRLDQEDKNYGFHLSNLLQLVRNYLEHYHAWSAETRRSYWISHIGMAQRQLPLAVAQEYCHRSRTYDGDGEYLTVTLSDEHITYPREKPFYYTSQDIEHAPRIEPWVNPSTVHESTGLGFDFALMLNHDAIGMFSDTSGCCLVPAEGVSIETATCEYAILDEMNSSAQGREIQLQEALGLYSPTEPSVTMTFDELIKYLI